MKLLIGLLTTLLLSVSCSNVKHLKNFETNEIPEGLKLSQIEKSIKKSGANRNWIFKKSKAANTLEGNLMNRRHEVNVSIPYTEKNYQINYVSSKHMKYNSSKNVIHRNYYRWVGNLQQEINRELRLAAASE